MQAQQRFHGRAQGRRLRTCLLCQAHRPSAFVSGASSGIGLATAELLAARGWQVFAGVRSSESAAELARLAMNLKQLRAIESGREKRGHLVPVMLDVTSEASVRAAAEQVVAAVGGDGLQGLVNNAGLCMVGPLETFPLDSFQHVMDVNLMGALRMTQTFLPLMRAGDDPRRRIVMVSSVAGSMSFPLFGAYNASKHALEGVSTALRYELIRQGVHVSVVAPGPVKTAIWRRASAASEERVLRAMDERARELYGPTIERVRDMIRESEEGGMEVDRVAQAVLHALSAPRPKPKYVVGKRSASTLLAKRLLPGALWDQALASYMKL